MTDSNVSVTAEGKYLTYQWKKDGVDLTGETNATLNITDANATQHDGKLFGCESNDFGSRSEEILLFLMNKCFFGWLLVGGDEAYETSGIVEQWMIAGMAIIFSANGPAWTQFIDGGVEF